VVAAAWSWIALPIAAAVWSRQVVDLPNCQFSEASWQADRLAGAALLPYAAWTGFATGLNAAIALRNPGR
jgi:tryptophan-rich sensory protein